VFNLTDLPKRLFVIGGGPIGCELAQAFRRLGSAVTLLHLGEHILDREDPDAAAIVIRAFEREGIEMLLGGWQLTSVEVVDGAKRLHLKKSGEIKTLDVDEILVGAGRVTNVDGLGLDKAGVEFDKFGVKADKTLRTTNHDIYAAGDIALPYKFTHTADVAARTVIQNALFMGSKEFPANAIPWCTYTDPEIAHVGMYEADVTRAGIEADTFMRDLNDVDRAILDGEDDGFVKVHVKKGTDKILGATIVAAHAGDLISTITVAMTNGIGLKGIAGSIFPYPTQAEAIKQVADMYSRTRLTPNVKKWMTRWLDFTR
jgi:pyruvate/2-oxoglutarate dehydrogenase complex dihydrolipoamide dehydrogenase (E3) component